MGVQEGDSFGHFHIRSHIAKGATGDVYRALDVQTGHEVALKIPTKECIIDPSKYEYFLRELEAMRLLQHPAVQHRIESGNYDGTPFLVTDLVDGKSLRILLKESGSFPLERAIALTNQIAHGLAYCHAQDIIHRDIKPDNILVTMDDQPVIIDFGLALSKAKPAGGKAAGTPDYMAPEQIKGHHCDKRTDVYAVGTQLYEMLTGKPPFIGNDPMAVMHMHLYEAVPRLDKVKKGIPPQVAVVVAKCLQRDPDQRYPDMPALISDLVHLVQVDTSGLEALCGVPPKPPFYKNQMVQAVLISIASIIGIVVLAMLLTSLNFSLR